jgi:hypothetical protein
MPQQDLPIDPALVNATEFENPQNGAQTLPRAQSQPDPHNLGENNTQLGPQDDLNLVLNIDPNLVSPSQQVLQNHTLVDAQNLSYAHLQPPSDSEGENGLEFPEYEYISR